MVRHVRGTRGTGIDHGDQDVSKLSPSTDRTVGGVEPRPTAWGGVCRVLARWPTTQPRQVRTASLAPWAVGRYLTMRYARGLRGTGFERGDNGILKLPPLAACGVDGPEPRPTAWEGVRPTLGHHDTAQRGYASLLVVRSHPRKHYVVHPAERLFSSFFKANMLFWAAQRRAARDFGALGTGFDGDPLPGLGGARQRQKPRSWRGKPPVLRVQLGRSGARFSGVVREDDSSRRT